VLFSVCALFLLGLPAARAMVAETEPPPAEIPAGSAVVAEQPPPGAEPGNPPEIEVPPAEQPPARVRWIPAPSVRS